MAKKQVLFRLLKDIKDGKLLPSMTLAFRECLEGTDETRAEVEPTVLISSTGGSLEEALRVHAFLTLLPQSVTTIACGLVASAANCVFLAGDRRLATPHSCFVFHGGFMGMMNVHYNEHETIVRAQQLGKQREANMIAATIGVAPDEALRWLREGLVLSVQDALERGIVHALVDDSFFHGKTVSFGNEKKLEET